MILSGKVVSLALAAAFAFVTIAAQTPQPGPAAQAATAKNAEIAQVANTKLAVYQAMPDAQKIAIYDQISRVYVQQQKSSPYATALANYLIFNEANKGEPIGYEVFLRYVKGIVAGKHAGEGVTGDTAGVYGTILHVGNSYLRDLQDKAKASNP